MRGWVLVVIVVAACGRDKDSALASTIAAAAAQLPGLQITVEHRGQVVLDAQYGFADVENRAPVTADTVFCIGSISKQFGATAILQLAEAGKLSLDDTLAKYVPGFPRGERITIRHLLRHVSGIEDFEYTGPWPPVMAVERTQDELIAMFRDRPPLFEPDTRWSYSTSNYVLLGEIVAKVSGQSLRDYMRDHVYARAGLEHTRFCDTYELIPNRAHGYDSNTDGFVPTAMQVLEQYSVGGGICSTTHDLLRWQKALEHGEVVSPASYQMMVTPLPLADGTPTGYGFGLFPSSIAGHRLVSHEGNVSGFTSGLYHFIDDDLRIAAITNHRSLGPPWFEAAQTELAIAPAVAVPSANLQRYAVETRVLSSTIRFAVDGDHLVANVTPGPSVLALVHTGNHVFELPNRSIAFVFSVDGERVTQVETRLRGMSFFQRY